MKKTLLAAALTLGFAGVAQAETSVTLYGVLDGGIGYQQSKTNTRGYNMGIEGTGIKAKRTGMINGVQAGNRWGLKGVEDLGNGLRVVFQLESGFSLGTGGSLQGSDEVDNRLFGRQATLGLAGDSWGQLDIGRQTNIASKYLPGVADPFGGGFGQANIGMAHTQADTVRYDNMVMYQTPNFSGFQFGVGYSFNVDGDQASRISGTGNPLVDDREFNKRGITTGLRYANGPIGVALTYDHVKTADYTNFAGETTSDTVSAWALGGSYDFEVVKVMASFGQTRNGTFNSLAGPARFPAVATGSLDGLKFNSYSLGLSAPIGAGTLLAGWHVADPRSTPDRWDAAGFENYEMSKQQTYSLGYTYGLSKRTNVYAIGSYAKNVHFQPDAKGTLIGVGLRHQF